MEPTTSGRFRLLESPRDDDERLLVDVSSCEPTYVDVEPHLARVAATTGNPDREATDLDRLVAGLRPGYVVDATLAWRDGVARFTDVRLVGRTLVTLVDGVEGLFEAARETCQSALDEGEPMESRVTHDTDGDPNGVVYVFADGGGASDTFDEFRRGALPLEPLVARVEEGRDDDDAREVFVMRPVDEPFVVVYITFEKGGLLANTVRDTYDCPRPDEPLAAADAVTEASEADAGTESHDGGASAAGNGGPREPTAGDESVGGRAVGERTATPSVDTSASRDDDPSVATGTDSVDPWGDGDDDWLDDSGTDPWGDGEEGREESDGERDESASESSDTGGR